MRFRFVSMTLDALELFEFSENFAGFRRFGRQQLLNKMKINKPVLSATALWPTECTFQHYVPCNLHWFAVDFFASSLYTHIRSAVARSP